MKLSCGNTDKNLSLIHIYEELAEMYFDKYPNLIESREEGFIWADLEIRGMAKRTDQGIISIGCLLYTSRCV